MAQERRNPLEAVLALGLALALLAAGGAAFAETAKTLRPDPGMVTYALSPGQVVDLFVNATPREGDVPHREWFLFATSKSGEIYFLTPEGAVPYRPDMDLDRVTYPYSHKEPTEFIARLTLGGPGLGPGDSLVYAYAYRTAEGRGVADNIVILKVAAGEGSLASFTSEAELEAYLKEALRIHAPLGGTPWAYDMGAPMAMPGSSLESSFSNTNLQEAGVDEADKVKTDGRYLYVAPSPQPRPYYLSAGDDGGPAADAEEPAVIRVLELKTAPPGAAEFSRIELRHQSPEVDGLYLANDLGPGEPHILAAVSGRSAGFWYFWGDPWYWSSGVTEVSLFDVTKPAEPKALGQLKLDGQLVASRRIGGVLYLVTRFTPTPPGYGPLGGGPVDLLSLEASLEKASLADLLPKIRLDGALLGSLVSHGECYGLPFTEDLIPEPTLVTVSAVDLRNPAEVVSRSVVGPTETVYVSTAALYLASTRYRDSEPLPKRAMLSGSAERGTRAPETTLLHKFALSAEGPVYSASGSVAGNLGWEPDKRPFRLSEYKGNLRVATSLGETWDETATTRLAVFQEDSSGPAAVLREIGHIDGIGLKGERLYATRYVGPRCYLVTFRVTDPLYVFDLSDPFGPSLLGELHIQGYSDYLHPVGENFLLGIGKDAVPSLAASDFGGRGAWYQGVKLSLFDVSDPARPEEVNSIVLGKRGTESDALYDHHAVTYRAPDEGGNARLAIPVRLHDTRPASPAFDPSKPWAYYDWTHTGLHLFEIDTLYGSGKPPGIHETGAMIVASRTETPYPDGYWGAWSDRSVLVGDSVHYVHQARVWSASWGSGADMVGPE